MYKELKYVKSDKAITLIALIITIIVLLILAGISISSIFSGDSVMDKAQLSSNQYNEAQIREAMQLAVIAASTNENFRLDENELKDQLDKQLGAGKYTYAIDSETGEVTVNVENKEYKISSNGSKSDVNAGNGNNNENLPNIEITASIQNINTSAKVSEIENRNVKINEETLKNSTLTGGFAINDKVMLYVSNTNSATLVGKYEVYKISNINENEITLDGDINTDIFTSSNCQLVKIAKYGQVKINNGVVITPSMYDGESGGIVAIEANEIILNGRIDVSNAGYDADLTAPNNGGKEGAPNCSRAGGSNKYKGGNGGMEYNGKTTGLASDAISISNNLQEKRMTFGGGSYVKTKGGGIIYINTQKLEIGSQYSLSANGQGSRSGVSAGGGAGGTICVNSKIILFNTENKDYFAGANAGSGGTEGFNSSGSNNWPGFNGNDGTNVKGGDAPSNNNGRRGGYGYLSNGGGGAQYGSNGGDATSTQGGTGAGTGYGDKGWNAGAGGGGRRIC